MPAGRGARSAHAAVPVMTTLERMVFWVLTVIAGVAIAIVSASWLALEDRRDHPWIYLAASGLVAFHVGVWLGRWMSLTKMRRPIPLRAPHNLRVGVATTFV